jgi:hypothetical protein
VTRVIYSHAVFFFSHHFFVVFYALLFIHSLEYFNPNFWKVCDILILTPLCFTSMLVSIFAILSHHLQFFLGPGTLYILERAYREYWAKRNILRVVRGVVLPG